MNPDVQMEAETLAYWCHVSPAADTADLMVFFAGQLHEARAEAAAKGWRDPVLAQEIIDLTELAGVLADAYRWQRPRRPVDPHFTNPLLWAG